MGLIIIMTSYHWNSDDDHYYHHQEYGEWASTDGMLPVCLGVDVV